MKSTTNIAIDDVNAVYDGPEGDLWELITAYNNVGIIEFSRGNFQIAAEYYEKSVRIDEKIGAVENEALARENLAEAFEMIPAMEGLKRVRFFAKAADGRMPYVAMVFHPVPDLPAGHPHRLPANASMQARYLSGLYTLEELGVLLRRQAGQVGMTRLFLFSSGPSTPSGLPTAPVA